MSVKVLVYGWVRDFQFRAIQLLAEEYGWEPCFWVGQPQQERDIRRQFPSCYFHNVYDAMKGVPHHDFPLLLPYPVTDPFCGQGSDFESMTLKLMDRMDPWQTFSYRERVRLFRRLVKYCTGILESCKIDLVLFPAVPHLSLEYVMYTVAHARGVSVLFFRETSVPGYDYLASRIEELPPYTSLYEDMDSNWAQQQSTVELPQALEEHLHRLSGQYSEAMPYYIKSQLSRKHALSTYVEKCWHVKRYPRYFAHVRRVLMGQSNYYKQRFRSIEDSRMGPLEHGLYRRIAKLKRWQLWRDYHRRAEVPDLDLPFVYVPLHYQPEATTCPDGGVIFSDQREVIDVLSAAMPEGWNLYVKEHVTQFVAQLQGDMGRDLSFYSDIDFHRNVRLVPVEYNSFRLIDASKAVATVTGTAGWEAIVRGIPTLVFGYPWYRGCEGAFYVPSYDLCKRALEVICDGYQVDHERVRLWLRAMDETCAKACICPSRAVICGYSDDENAQRLANAIAKCYAGLDRCGG